MKITRTCTIEMAHRLPNHSGKCRHLHGHRYRIEVDVEGDVSHASGTSGEGMVIDFGEIDSLLNTFVKRFDHRTMLWADDPLLVFLYPHTGQRPDDDVPPKDIGIDAMIFVPTAENLAAYWLDMLMLQRRGVTEVRVWETERGMAACRTPWTIIPKPDDFDESGN